MQVDVRILRFDPERDAKPHWEAYDGRGRADGPRRSTCSTPVKWEQDGTLTFRRSCAHGVCGSDAMLINGRNRLACKIRVDQLGREITVAPLPGPAGRSRTWSSTWTASSPSYRSVEPYLINDDAAARARAAPVAGAARALRRHDQVHPVRRLHQLLPVVLGPARLRRPGRHRQRPPLHLRLPRRGGRGAPRDPGRQGRRLALPHDLQLHGRLPARHQHHPGDPGGLGGHRRAARLSDRSGPAGTAAGPLAPRHPHGRGGPRQPRPGLVRARSSSTARGRTRSTPTPRR